MKQILCGLLAMVIIGCSTETYVSQENIDKFNDPLVEKFVIRECLLPNAEVRIAVASHFDFDKDVLKEQDRTRLMNLVQNIKGLKGQISIVGHTDVHGSNAYNDDLSLRRAKSVQAFLQSQLQEADYSWEIRSYGKRKLLEKVSNRKSDAKNRRAFVVFEETVNAPGAVNCPAPEAERKVLMAMTSHFDFDKSVLKAEDEAIIDEFVENIEGVSGRLLIAGHTDPQGSLSYNDALAKRRANAVVAYLKTQLNEKDYLWDVRAFGERDLLATGKSLEDNLLNRRVVLIFKEEPIEKKPAVEEGR